jgi:hypothetical protein
LFGGIVVSYVAAWIIWRERRRMAAFAKRLICDHHRMRSEKRMLETRLSMTGGKLIQVKKQLGQKFPEGYK